MNDDERGELQRCEGCGKIVMMWHNSVEGERFCRDCCDEDAIEKEIEAGRMIVDWDGNIIEWDGRIIE